MKIISLNIRGLGGGVKKRYLSDLIGKKQVGMVCLRESKCSKFGAEKCFQLWGSNEIE